MLTIEKAMDLIHTHKTVAIAGLSPNPKRPSHLVGNFLKDRGYQIIPVNPGPHNEILGEVNRKNLANLSPGEADWLDLFVNPTRLLSLLPEVIRLNPKLVWCQIGVVNESFK